MNVWIVDNWLRIRDDRVCSHSVGVNLNELEDVNCLFGSRLRWRIKNSNVRFKIEDLTLNVWYTISSDSVSWDSSFQLTEEEVALIESVIVAPELPVKRTKKSATSQKQ